MNGTFENSTFSLDNNICVLIPVYNSGALIQNVIASLLAKKVNILVVNDGSTDNTENFIKEFLPKIHYISYPINKGKGYALQQGFAEALRLGYRFAITMDADGQHKAEDLIYFAEQFSSTPNAILLGVRNFNQENMSSSSRFANKFSNFWFMLQTALKISDTQTGYRMYPLQQIKNIHLLTQGYATELVKAVSGYMASRFDTKVIYGRVVHGNAASVKVLEKSGYQFVREESGAEDDPYGNGMLVYRKDI